MLNYDEYGKTLESLASESTEFDPVLACWSLRASLSDRLDTAFKHIQCDNVASFLSFKAFTQTSG